MSWKYFSKKSFFDKKIFDIDLSSINNTVLKSSGASASIFNFGDLELIIKINEQTKKKKINYIYEALVLKDRIDELSQEIKLRNKKTFLGADEIIEKTPIKELFKVIKQVRELLGDEKFEESLNKED